MKFFYKRRESWTPVQEQHTGHSRETVFACKMEVMEQMKLAGKSKFFAKVFKKYSLSRYRRVALKIAQL